MRSEFKKGIYRHYKGSFYSLEDIALHSETDEPFAVYRPMYGERGLWIRPWEMFEESVFVNGEEVPRFAYYCSKEDYVEK